MKFADIQIGEKFVYEGRVYVRLNHHTDDDGGIVNAQSVISPDAKFHFGLNDDVFFGNVAYTHAEAQAILAFAERALNRCYKRNASFGYALQIELDRMCKQLDIKQSFDRLLPSLADEGMGIIGPNHEVGEL